MADLQASTALSWGEATGVQNRFALSWGEAVEMQSRGSAYTVPGVGSGTLISADSLEPLRDITGATRYVDTSVLSVVDLRSGAALPVTSVSLDLSDGSDLWTLQAAGNGALADTLRAGVQPATVEVTLGTDKWRFVVEEISQPRTFENTDCVFRGRSLASAAGAPYQAVQTWIADAPSTPAQLASLATTYTGVAVDWGLIDWLLPAGVWSASTDPLGVVRQMAASVGAVVEADRLAPTLRVRPRYPTAPNLWATQRPDVQIAWEAVEAASQERNDQPEYDGVLVAGLQSGGLLQARLEGTAGTTQAPMIADPLLTETSAQVERAQAVLYGFGGRARETRTLQISGGVVARGALVRCVDPSETWVGMVRSVSVQASLAQARQTITMERPTSFPAGSAAPEPLTCALDPYEQYVKYRLNFEGLDTPFVFADAKGNVWARSGAGHPAELTLSAAQKKFGGSALLMRTTSGAAGDFGIAATANGGDYSLGAGNKFTQEAWVFIKSGANYVSRISAGEVRGTASQTICGMVPGGATYGELAFTTSLGSDHTVVLAIPQDQWVHVEMGYDGTTKYVFLQGILQASAVLPAGSPKTVRSYQIQGIPVGTEFVQPAYIDAAMFTAGACRHTSNFDLARLPYCEHA